MSVTRTKAWAAKSKVLGNETRVLGLGVRRRKGKTRGIGQRDDGDSKLWQREVCAKISGLREVRSRDARARTVLSLVPALVEGHPPPCTYIHRYIWALHLVEKEEKTGRAERTKLRLEAKVRDVPGQEARSKGMSHGAEKEKLNPGVSERALPHALSVSVCEIRGGEKK